jgi:hypothetical protein
MGHMYVSNKEAKHAKTECRSEAVMAEYSKVRSVA